MEVKADGNGSLYIQWTKGHDRSGEACEQRAWVQHRNGARDWAGTGRYLNIVRCNANGNPGGNATDFPIYGDLPDVLILESFVRSVMAITGYGSSERDD